MKKQTLKPDNTLKRMLDKPFNAYIPPRTSSTIERILELTTKKPNHEILYTEC